MLRVEMLPAANGDCLWIEYGTADDVHRILIDGGRARTYEHLRARILALPAAARVFELLVITHIDNDHVEGVLPLLQDSALGCRFNDIWYNGWRHLEPPPAAAAPADTLGPREGEFLGVLLDDAGLPWNTAFGGGPVVVTDDGDLPARELAGGLTLTLLSPTPARLTALATKWRKVIEDAGFRPGDIATMRAELAKRKYLPRPADVLGGVQDGPGGTDNSDANGSSIAVLASYDGKQALLTGDAFADVLAASVTRTGATQAKPLTVDLWKLAHHGSWANFTPELFALVRTSRYLVSTDGSTFGHPHATTLDHIIDHYPWRGRPELVFNYRTATTEPWAGPASAARKYASTYPTGAVVLL
jgi:hypothetical protein